jgi:hypothetical protein
VLGASDARNICAPDDLEAAFPPAKLSQIAIDVLRCSLEKDGMGRISFNDMVWLPVAAGWVKPTFSLVVVDEAQDMNMPQLLMAERSCKPGGRICIVGDDRQAIYGFRGAASDGMHLMKQRLNAGTLGLTTTIAALPGRAGQRNRGRPHRRASAPEGGWREITERRGRLAGYGDAVLSRPNAPRMASSGSPPLRGAARVEGSHIGQQLVGMVRAPRPRALLTSFANRLFGERQVRRAQAGGGRAQSKTELFHPPSPH